MWRKKRTKNIFNVTENSQFTTRLKINDDDIEVIDSTRLLGNIIENNLSWDLNTANLVKKANGRMELLRRVASFGPPPEDSKLIYILFVRSILEQSATVWQSSLSQENANDLERVQKSALKIILNWSYKSYEQSLAQLDIQTLNDRREMLCLNFALECVKNEKMKNMFPVSEKTHRMPTRDENVYKVHHANTGRLQK